jgi:vacuolar-type H+-ATPase subunit E/Vma4
MKSEDPNIGALSRAVLREAHGDAERVMAEAKEKADAIRQHAQQEAASVRAEILEQANREAERIHSELISTAQLKARSWQLEQREKLLDEVYKTARQQLNALQQRADYEQIVRFLLKEALSQLRGEQVQVRTDQVTQKFLTYEVLADVSKETGMQVQFGTLLDQGTGVVAETLDGHRRFDNTFEARLNRMQDALRSSVYHLLMGEPL